MRKTLAVIYLLTYLLIASYEVTRIQQIFVTTFKWTENIALYTGISILALILFFAFASKRFSQFIAVLTCVLLISTSAKPVIDEIGKPPQLEAENTDEYKDIPKSTCASWDKKCLTNHEIEIAPQQQYNNELLERKNAIKKRNKDLLEKGNTTDYQEVANRILGILFVSIITSFGVYYTAHEFAKTIVTSNGQACLSTTTSLSTTTLPFRVGKKHEKNYPTDEVIIALYKSGRTQESLYKEFGHRKRIEKILAPIKCKDVSRHVPTTTTIIETEPNLFETKQEQTTNNVGNCRDNSQTTDEQNKNKQETNHEQTTNKDTTLPFRVGNIIEFKKKAS